MAQKSRTDRAPSAPAVVRFGPFELDLRSAELRRNDLRIRLQDQPFQILLLLLERPGEVVLREEIRQKLWPNNTVVEFDHSINAAVKRLRDVLRDSAEEPRYIETLPKRGYRFIAQLEPASSEPAELTVSEPAELKVSEPIASSVPVASPGDHTGRPRIPPARVSVPVTAALLLAMALAAAWYHRTAPARWARKVALPEATRLVSAGNYPAAFSLLVRSRQVIPQDPALNSLLREISHPLPIHTTPPGASVSIKAYEDLDGPWLPIGQSPIENFLLPLGYYRWRIMKKGFRTMEAGAGFQSATIDFTLDPEGSVPAEMVHVPRGEFQLFSLNRVHLHDYWMDKYEVTNKQFKEFVDQGGYKNRQYWREEFVKDGRVLSWEQALGEFRDMTGRPGPSTWELGGYPPGHEDFPVNGVSWYEAAAYAEFAQKQIPTIYHWFRAARLGIWSDILHFSNFDRSGPGRVGSRSGVGPFGTYDMAGNVREWCWNATGNLRYILGGAWNDERYVYGNPNAVPPFNRSPANGFRCVKYPGGALSTVLTQPIERPSRDYRTEQPVSDRIYRILQRFYTYDRTELQAVRESVDESSPYWRAERITFNAAYDHQRVIAWLYLPKNITPPYQTIIYFPPRSARYLARIDEADVKRIDFLVKTGRAVLFPVYQGTYERRATEAPGPSRERDRIIEQCKDLQRSVDYLQTRPEIARDRLGYYGVSDGARLGLILLAEETRIRAAVLSAGGLSAERKPPEIDEINFAPRVRIPVLMLNGRYDLSYPAETAQVSMFHLLGTPEREKRHVLFDTGHVTLQQQDKKDTLNWFDKYLGPTGK
jgi:DNA-binding winged helix-turn-helix (wHTH) protein/cephalosporin-C deacetylase-like acetyl esterase